MAEIHIERNERSIRAWVIVGLLALGLLAWLVVQRGTSDGDGRVAVDSAAGSVTDTNPATNSGTRSTTPAAVSEYLAFVDENRSRQPADSSHDYTADGLRRLAAALAALVDRDTVAARPLDSQVAWLHERADALRMDWRSADHSRTARDAFLGAASLIQALHEQRFPNLGNEATDVVNAALALDPNVQLLRQKARVQQFFDHTAEAVRSMASTLT